MKIPTTLTMEPSQIPKLVMLIFQKFKREEMVLEDFGEIFLLDHDPSFLYAVRTL
jgi:hypothetical protein